MTSPQPLQVRRRGGAKRGDHGSYVTPEPPDRPETPPTPSAPSESIGTDTARSGHARSRRTVGAPVTDAAAAAKAAYDSKPKVIVRGVDEDVYYKLRAIYKHQLRTPNGIEGWSEFGRQLLRDYVDHYEQQHGEMTGGENVELPAGRRIGQ